MPNELLSIITPIIRYITTTKITADVPTSVITIPLISSLNTFDERSISDFVVTE